ncbi:MATE family multidrug exporter [compost metagenome]
MKYGIGLIGGMRTRAGTIPAYKQIIPIFVDQAFIILMSLINTAMIASSGVAAVSAVSMVDSLNIFLINVFVAVATGGTVIVVQYKGSGNQNMVSRVASQAISAVAILAVILGVVVIAFHTSVLNILFGQADAEVFENTRTYLIGSCISYPFIAIFQAVTGALREMAETKACLGLLLIMNLTYLGLNILLISVLHMGVMGLVISVITARVLGMIISLVYIIKMNQSLQYRLRHALHLDSLSHIRNSIRKIEDKHNRLFFWCMFSDIVRKYSNSRSSTYKLHTKTEEDINRFENNSVNDFIKAIETNWDKYNKNFHSFTLYKGNTLSLMNQFRENQFDICITSPPYGDNNTTVPYGQFSMLPLYWIDSKDLELEGWEFDNYSTIDSKSLGGAFSLGRDGKVGSSLLNPYLLLISPEKQKKVLRFFSDYFIFLDQISMVTSTHIIMTLGNRTVDGIKINLTEITVQYLTHKGFIKREILERDILSKRIPKKVSSVKSKPVSSMNKEYVIVMDKIS